MALTLYLASCSSVGAHRDVGPNEFLELAHLPIGSTLDSTLIGVANGRVYLSVWSGMPSSVGGGHDVYSVRLAQLPSDIAERLRRGEDPFQR